MDIHHLLLILLFLLHGLLTEEVEEYNRINPLVRIVDPYPIIVEVAIMILSKLSRTAVNIFAYRAYTLVNCIF